MTDIEKNLKRLNEILKIFPAAFFYNITVTEYAVELQGYKNHEVSDMAIKNEFALQPRDEYHNGYDVYRKPFEDGERRGYFIILT